MNRIDATCEQLCMATSRGRYYTEMIKTLTDYNDCNNTPLSNVTIRESIYKFVKEGSMADSNNVAAYTFSNVSNTQRENANTKITTENLYKSDELVDAVKNSTINNAEY